MPDWDDESGSDSPQPPNAMSKKKPPVPMQSAKNKWDGEDEEDDGPVSDWEESSSSEEEQSAAVVTTAPPKKKGTLKAKLAEKAAAKAAREADGEDDDDDDDDESNSEEVVDPGQKARLERQREVNEDLKNAAELFGGNDKAGKSKLESLVSFQPRTKDDFEELSRRIIECVIQKHQSKPLYPAFVEYHVRQLAMPLRDVEVRKAASGLTTLANEKQKEQREKASGKKKSKAASKPNLGAVKANKQNAIYDTSLDDFGNNPDDFM